MERACRSAGRTTRVPLLALTLGFVSLAARPGFATEREPVEHVEQRRFAAMIAQDVAALEPMLAEELSYVHSTGEHESKAMFLETIRSGRLRYLALDVKGLDVHRYGDIALLTGRLTARAQAGEQQVELDIRFTDAYVHRDGRWQLVAWHSTRIQ